MERDSFIKNPVFWKRVVGVDGCCNIDESDDDWNKRGYYDAVRKATIKNHPEILTLIPSHIGNIYAFQVDHIVPVWAGWTYRISIEEISSVDNLQLISLADNSFATKHGKGTSLPEYWFRYITEKNWVYLIGNNWYQSLLHLCTENGLSYVMAASGFFKKGLKTVTIEDLTIELLELKP